MSKNATTAVNADENVGVEKSSASRDKLTMQAASDRPPTHPLSTSGRGGVNPREYTPGYSSGASTPSHMDDTSVHSGNYLSESTHNAKMLKHSASAIGLERLIEDKKTNGNLAHNIVHMEVPFGKPIEEVYDGVHDGPVLGSGISGLVRLCKHRKTGSKYAVKCLDLGLVDTDEGLQQLREEIAIMCQLDHPNIV